MIDLTKYKDPARVIRNAALDDATPCDKGTSFLYWKGATDLDPKGPRAKVFHSVYDLYERGIVNLYQTRNGEDDYSYFAVVG